ncbi:hypothetical protein [Zavarzinella formosa]|uniref:hypothetical protein n=1 Tax=Zavarzinella formosa TaxID=360055 RepID=UPI0012FC1201|nr:hypothetical protein [Zavarzinella formosa]
MVTRRWALATGIAYVVTSITVGVMLLPDNRQRAAAEPDDHCPRCGEREKIGLIFYGLYKVNPPPSPLGGCVITEDSPKWHCYKCGRRWGRIWNSRQGHSQFEVVDLGLLG